MAAGEMHTFTLLALSVALPPDASLGVGETSPGDASLFFISLNLPEAVLAGSFEVDRGLLGASLTLLTPCAAWLLLTGELTTKTHFTHQQHQSCTIIHGIAIQWAEFED